MKGKLILEDGTKPDKYDHRGIPYVFYANEINEQIALNKLKFVEVPVNIRYTDYSLWKGQKNSNSWKLWFKMIYEKFFWE